MPIFMLAIFVAACDTTGSKKPSDEKNPSGPYGRKSSNQNQIPGTESLKVAIIYDKSKVQMYLNSNKEFPVATDAETDDEFSDFVKKMLQDTVVPTTNMVSPPADFSLTLLKKLEVQGFGTIFFYYWDYDLIRGNVYKDAMALMVFDDGGNAVKGAFNMTSENAKISIKALKHFLRDPDLVNKLHKNGFKIPGEENLYNTLKAVDSGIDLSKYPDLHI